MKRFKRSKKGFTLIELIVVVAILAILAAVAVPNFVGMTTKAKEATEKAAAAELCNAYNIQNTLSESNAGYTKLTSVPIPANLISSLKDDLKVDIGSADPAEVYRWIKINNNIFSVSSTKGAAYVTP